MFTLIFSLMLHAATADTLFVCGDSTLGKSLSALETQSRELVQPSVQDWIQPVLDEAKIFAAARPPIQGYVSLKTIDQITQDFQSSYKSELDRLEKDRCISHITSAVQKKILGHLEFTSPHDVELDQGVRNTPNPSTYLFNQNEYEKLALSQLNTQKLYVWRQAQVKLDRAFPKQKSLIGRLSPSEHLLLTYSRTEINLLANLFMETLTLMTADSMQATATSSVTKREVDLTFSPTDLANLSIRYLERGIAQLNMTRSFAAKPIDKVDVVMAAFYNQEADAESVLVLLKNKSINEPRDTFLKHLATLGWGAAKVVLYQIPVTMPFITFATLLYDAIQSKKQLERSKADAAHLIPSH